MKRWSVQTSSAHERASFQTYRAAKRYARAHAWEEWAGLYIVDRDTGNCDNGEGWYNAAGEPITAPAEVSQ